MSRPDTAMILAAGLGSRMRPLTNHMPKPLIEVGGQTLIDRALDCAVRSGVKKAVVNVHYRADMVERHLAGRHRPSIVISDERAQLLDSAGAIVKALPQLGERPFFIMNADTFWLDHGVPNLQRMALAWDDKAMDILLMVAEFGQATGHTGKADFVIGEDRRLKRARNGEHGVIYAGAALVHPRIFSGARVEPHSLNRYFDDANAEGRLFGMVMEGDWLTVGTPDAIAPAESVIARHNRRRNGR